MCKWNKNGNKRIDPCMRKIVSWLNHKHITVASCCGHGRYPPSIIIKEGIRSDDNIVNRIIFREIFSATIIPRKKRFYKKDKQGHYYIPEVSKVR